MLQKSFKAITVREDPIQENIVINRSSEIFNEKEIALLDNSLIFDLPFRNPPLFEIIAGIESYTRNFEGKS